MRAQLTFLLVRSEVEMGRGRRVNVLNISLQKCFGQAKDGHCDKPPHRAHESIVERFFPFLLVHLFEPVKARLAFFQCPLKNACLEAVLDGAAVSVCCCLLPCFTMFSSLSQVSQIDNQYIFISCLAMSHKNNQCLSLLRLFLGM